MGDRKGGCMDGGGRGAGGGGEGGEAGSELEGEGKERGEGKGGGEEGEGGQKAGPETSPEIWSHTPVPGTVTTLDLSAHLRTRPAEGGGSLVLVGSRMERRDGHGPPQHEILVMTSTLVRCMVGQGSPVRAAIHLPLIGVTFLGWVARKNAAALTTFWSHSPVCGCNCSASFVLCFCTTLWRSCQRQYMSVIASTRPVRESAVRHGSIADSSCDTQLG